MAGCGNFCTELIAVKCNSKILWKSAFIRLKRIMIIFTNGKSCPGETKICPYLPQSVPLTGCNRTPDSVARVHTPYALHSGSVDLDRSIQKGVVVQ
jgi:hypothetical protein